MTVCGILCEYNPLHLGHRKQFRLVRQAKGQDCAIVALMSGNFVQRGEPALLDKMVRARAAVLSGADLVLELPVEAALSSAEGFAAGAVRILSPICDCLCFGAEHPDPAPIRATAQALLSPEFPQVLREELSKGLSFPAARQSALEAAGHDAGLLCSPNDILAVEYAKAILAQHSPLEMLPVLRAGSYHAAAPDPENPSATSLRLRMLRGETWEPFVPAEAVDCYRSAPLHTLEAGERAILARLRTMRDDDFTALPFGSEGLWRKLMHEARRQSRVEDILEAVKSKRYTRTRISRMLLCAYLGLTEAELAAPAPYVRVLAFDNKGREILRRGKEALPLVNIGQTVSHPREALEARLDDLYALFALPAPEPAGRSRARRVFYLNR